MACRWTRLALTDVWPRKRYRIQFAHGLHAINWIDLILNMKRKPKHLKYRQPVFLASIGGDIEQKYRAYDSSKQNWMSIFDNQVIDQH